MNNEIYFSSGNKSNRLLALDAVRGLAVIGMYIQHFALKEQNAFVSGNTMILFIFCSGISYVMMAESMKRKTENITVFRARILARSVFIDLIGYIILMLNCPFAVVLQTYAMLYILTIGLIKCSKRKLIIISVIGFILCPPLMTVGRSLFEGTALLSDIAGGSLSALAWFPVFTVGMAVGKMELKSAPTAVTIAVTGLVILVPIKMFTVYILPNLYEGFSAWLMQFPSIINPQTDPYAVWPKNTAPPLWHMLLMDAPQGGSSFELLIGTGGSLILMGAALITEKKFTFILSLFANIGKAALTLYSAQFVVAWFMMILGIDPTTVGSLIPWGDIVIGAVVLAVGQLISLMPGGPLELAIRKFESMFYKI